MVNEPAQSDPGFLRAHADWHWHALNGFAGGDDERAHAAADAALKAQAAGGDQQQMLSAAQAAAASGQPASVEAARRSYTNWYQAYRQRLTATPEQAHAAAWSALQAQLAGMPVEQVAREAARAAHLSPGQVTQARGARGQALPFWMDPAGRAIIYGSICLLVALFGIHFLIIPVFGLIYSLRSLQVSRPALAIPAVIINVLSMTVTIALTIGFFR